MRQLTGLKLWLGNAHDGRDARCILDADIQAVVDLALEEPPANLPRELAYLRFPLLDGAGNPPWLLHSAVDTVTGLLRESIPTLVCCGAGMSRSPAIVAAALARLRGLELGAALAQVTSPDGPVDQSPGLIAELTEFAPPLKLLPSDADDDLINQLIEHNAGFRELLLKRLTEKTISAAEVMKRL